jgi:hypothetical protein
VRAATQPSTKDAACRPVASAAATFGSAIAIARRALALTLASELALDR